MYALSVYAKTLKARSQASFSPNSCRMFLGVTLGRAHRSLLSKPGPGDRPRPVIICFHCYQQKELVIREARKRGNLTYKNNSFRVYEDYTQEVAKQRKGCRSVMSSLYKMGLKSSLLYPARLQITEVDGTRTGFGSVAEAEKFIQDLMAPNWLLETRRKQDCPGFSGNFFIYVFN